MPIDPFRIQELFLAALELPAEARVPFLDREAAGDAALRARVDALLRAHDQPDSLLDAPVIPAAGVAGSPGDPTGPEAGEGFALEEEIGRGANGVVYRARQRGLNRVVAVKLALGWGVVARHALARFLAEAEAVASIDHPHVVRVYGFGHRVGVPYIAMEYLGGGTLADRLKASPLPARDAAELIGKVAAGVAAAHAQGIVHRDLKPGNVLLDGAGEPRVTDFGLARRGAGSDLTATHAVMGTPAYMAPEQARGGGKFAGPPADVWALGVILYQSVSGSRPFAGESDEAVLAQIGSSEPRPLRSLVRGVPKDLDTIVGKCLAKEPERRYPTAAELADDLGRFARGEPITARPVGRFERAYRWARRKPTVAALYAATCAAVALLAVTSVVAGLWRTAEDAKAGTESARQAEEEARQAAERERDEKESARRAEAAARKAAEDERERVAVFEYGRAVQLAHQAVRDGDHAGAVKILEGTQERHRGWEWHYVRRLCNTTPGATLTGWRLPLGEGSVYWTPDGGRFAAVSEAGRVAVFDAPTGKQVVTLDGDTGVSATSFSRRLVAFNADGSRLLTHGDGPARLWDAATGKLLAVLDGAGSVTWSRDGARVLGTAHHLPKGVPPESVPAARRWDSRTGAEVPTHIPAGVPAGSSALWDPDGTRLAVATRFGLYRWQMGLVRVIDVERGTDVVRLPHASAAVDLTAWNPDGTRLTTEVVTGTDYRRWDYRLWDATTGALLPFHYRLHRNELNEFGQPPVRFSADGTRMVFVGRSSRNYLWDPESQGVGPSTVTEPDPDAGGGPALRPTGDLVLVDSVDYSGPVLDSKPRVDPKPGNAPPWNGQVPAWRSPDGRYLAGVPKAGPASLVHVWDHETGEETVLRGHTGGVTTLVWAPLGRQLATWSEDKTVRVWSLPSGGGVLLKGPFTAVPRVDWSPDGRRLLTTEGGDRCRVWDAATGDELAALRGQAPEPGVSPWAPDGRRLTLRPLNAPVRDGRSVAYVVWDAATGKEVHAFTAGVRPTPPVWRADGKRALFLMGENVQVWDAESWRPLAVLKGEGQVARAQWSADGGRVLTCDGVTATIWDPTAGNRLVHLALPNSSIRSAFWQPGGHRVLTNSDEPGDARPEKFGMTTGKDTWVTYNAGLQTVSVTRVWDGTTGALIRTFMNGHGGSQGFDRWSPDGKRVRLWAPSYPVHVFDPRTGARVAELGEAQWGRVKWAAPSPDGTKVVTCSGGPEQLARVWDVRTGVLIAVLEGHAGDVESATWTRDGRRVVTTSSDRTARVWDAATGRQLARLASLEQRESRPGPMTLSPDGNRILASAWNGIEIWDLRPARVDFAPRGHAGSVTRGGLVWSRDGSRLVSAGADGTVRLLDPATGREVSVVGRHAGPVTALAFSPSGREFATASADGTARVWDARTGRQLGLLEGHRGAVTGVSFSPNGSYVATTSADDTARVWSVPPGGLLPQRPVAVLEHPGTPLGWAAGTTAASWSPDGSRLAVAWASRPVRVWDTTTWRTESVVHGSGVLWSPRGDRFLVTTPRDGNSKREVSYSLWDAATNRVVWPAEGGFGGWGAGVTWAPDGRHFLVYVDGGVLRDAKTGEVVSRFHSDGANAHLKGMSRVAGGVQVEVFLEDFTKGKVWSETFPDLRSAGRAMFERGVEDLHERLVLDPAFSQDGKSLLTGREDGCRIWDVKTQKQLRVLWGDQLPRFIVAVWSPDGGRVATGHADGSVRVWDAATGEVRATAAGSPAVGVTSATWHPSGRWVLTSGFGLHAQVWDAETGTPLKTLSLVADKDKPGMPRLPVTLEPGATWPDGSEVRATPTRWSERPVSAEGVVGERMGPVPAPAAAQSGHAGGVLTASPSPDGSRVATSGADRTVRVWHAATGAELLVLRGEADGLADARFQLVSWSPDGHRVLTSTVGRGTTVLDATPLGR